MRMMGRAFTDFQQRELTGNSNESVATPMNRSTVGIAAGSAHSPLNSSRQKSRWRVRYIILGLLALLAGCIEPVPGASVPRTLPCPSLADSPWAEFLFGIDSPSEVVSAVVDIWGIHEDRIGEMSSVEGPILRWRTDVPGGQDDIFLASFNRKHQLKKIKVKWTWPNPTLAQIIDCLGFPDHYIAFEEFGPEHIFIKFALFYTDDGIVIRDGGTIWTVGPPRIRTGMKIDGFVLVAPGAEEQMGTEMYRYGQEPNHLIYSLCLSKPWPGAVEAMEIASNEEVEECGVFRDW